MNAGTSSQFIFHKKLDWQLAMPDRIIGMYKSFKICIQAMLMDTIT